MLIAAVAFMAAVAACQDDALDSITGTGDERVARPPRALGHVLVGAGNIARCDDRNDEATARLLKEIPGTVFTTGDNVRSGTASEYTGCYGESWGRYKARTRPAAGDADYRTADAAAYYDYFGAAAGAPGKGYYSYDAGTWHVVVLNSSLSLDPDSEQLEWLVDDLAASRTACTIAYWHYPRFSSYSTPVREAVKPAWDVLWEAGADVVVNGHYRVYERFGPQNPDGEADAEYGIRQFTVGTGGHGSDAFGDPRPNSEVREAGAYGVLMLDLQENAYAWTFLGIRGENFTDAGSATCHGRPGGEEEAVEAVTVTPSSATVEVGDTVRLTAIAVDAKGDVVPGHTMTWTTRDSLIARVTSAGVVTGIAAGGAYILATSEGKRDSALVSVQTPGVPTVTVTPPQATVETGMTTQLTVSVTDGGGQPVSDPLVVWSSSAPGVATVDSRGLMTGVTQGSATIAATFQGMSGTASVTVTQGPVVRSGHYVTPDGSAGGDGTPGRPWDLTTALSGGSGAIQPGDTVWLRGGTYRGAFSSTLAGNPGAPIVVRQYPGERAVIDVAGATSGGSRGDAFVVRGEWTVWWGFEIMSSDPNRFTDTRPNMVVNNASHTRYVNLVVHDGGIGFFNYPSRSDVEIDGCIFYNNGWQGSSQGGGHGMYLKSNTGPVVARNNVMFNQFGYGIQVYSNFGSGKLTNITLDGNVAFNNGALSSQYASSGNANLLVGGQEPAQQSRVVNNMTYFSPGIGVYNVVLGLSSYTNQDVTLLNNYMVGGQYVLNVGHWDAVNAAGNLTVGSGRVVRLKDTSLNGYVWTQNTHKRDPNATGWQYDGSNYTFDSWRSRTGLGVTDQASSGGLGSPQVFVRPSAYEPGRAVVVVYNWGGASTVSVDLSTVLGLGAQYEVRNVQDLFGAPVAEGAFSGTFVTLPMNGVAPPAPVGGAPNTPPVTGPSFDVFVVTAR